MLVSRVQQLVTTDTAAGDESCNGSATNSGSPPRATLGEMPTRWQGLSNSLYVPAPFRTHFTSLSNTMSHGGAHADGEQGPSLGRAPRRLERQHTNTKHPPTTRHTQHSHTENDTHTNTHRHPENDTHTHRPQTRLWTQTLRQGPSSGVNRDRQTNTRRGRRVRRSKAHLRLAKPVERQHRK